MSNAADGYLGDWLPHKPKCRCTDCQLDRAQQRERKLRTVLEEALEYFEDRQDADHNGERFVPNKEMRMAQTIREALGEAE